MEHFSLITAQLVEDHRRRVADEFAQARRQRPRRRLRRHAPPPPPSPPTAA